MITLYVNGKALGPWSESEGLFQEAASQQCVEFRDAAGRVIASTAPLLDWPDNITPEETQRRLAGEFVSFEEVKKRLGWE